MDMQGVKLLARDFFRISNRRCSTNVYNAFNTSEARCKHMPSRYTQFDRDRIELRPLIERGHDLLAKDCMLLGAPRQRFECPALDAVIAAIRAARSESREVVVMMGAHPIKLGLSRFIIDLIERGYITHVAMNGAGIIHDFELATAGGTSEDVAKHIRAGHFGMWSETSQINDAIERAARNNEGLGEALGRFIESGNYLNKGLSICAAGYRCRVPVTVHVTIGADIIHAHANCDGAAIGKTSYTDFLIFTSTIQRIEGGVYLNIGTSVTGPEVYLKALSMVRNVARQEGATVNRFTTAVFDLSPLPDDWRTAVPNKSEVGYYFRPWKTILVRTVADGGVSHYICGDHRETIPALWHQLVYG